MKERERMGMSSDDNKSRTFELKQKLMRRAWDGQSRLAASGAEMILLIQMRLAQCKPPKGFHEFALAETRLIDLNQPRTVKMLNTIARYDGQNARYSETTENGMTIH